MKTIIFILLLSPVALAEEDQFAITTKITDYPARNAKAGKTIREQTFRGNSKIRDHTEKDTDNDGIMDFFFDAFMVDGSVVYSTTRTKSESSTAFSSHGDINVQLTESKTARQLQQICFLTSKGVLREMFVRNAKGVFEPLSNEEFKKALQDTKRLSPLLEGIIDSIQDAEPQKTPNNSLLPTGNSPTTTNPGQSCRPAAE